MAGEAFNKTVPVKGGPVAERNQRREEENIRSGNRQPTPKPGPKLSRGERF